MKKRVLITGGAGFVGSHLADELLAHGYAVRALDVLLPQAHPGLRGVGRPDYLNPAVELLVGDICDPEAVRPRSGASMPSSTWPRPSGWDRACTRSPTIRCEQPGHRRAAGGACLGVAAVARLIVASSMSIYGEGRYGCRWPRYSRHPWPRALKAASGRFAMPQAILLYRCRRRRASRPALASIGMRSPSMTRSGCA